MYLYTRKILRVYRYINYIYVKLNMSTRRQLDLSRLPTDNLIDIIGYGVSLPVDETALIDRIFTVNPNYNFNKDLILAKGKNVAMKGKYAKLIQLINDNNYSYNVEISRDGTDSNFILFDNLDAPYGMTTELVNEFSRVFPDYNTRKDPHRFDQFMKDESWYAPLKNKHKTNNPVRSYQALIDADVVYDPKIIEALNVSPIVAGNKYNILVNDIKKFDPTYSLSEVYQRELERQRVRGQFSSYYMADITELVMKNFSTWSIYISNLIQYQIVLKNGDPQYLDVLSFDPTETAIRIDSEIEKKLIHDPHFIIRQINNINWVINPIDILGSRNIYEYIA
ncbi:hypothetical protein D3C87_1139770 [compost metagenome]